MELEARGIATAIVVIEPMTPVAESTKRIMGIPGYEYCVMGRPYAGLTPEESATQAKRLIPRINQLLTSRQAYG
jgi:hypothetical protein